MVARHVWKEWSEFSVETHSYRHRPRSWVKAKLVNFELTRNRSVAFSCVRTIHAQGYVNRISVRLSCQRRKHWMYENNTTTNTAVKIDCNMNDVQPIWARSRMHSHAQIKWTHDFFSAFLSVSPSVPISSVLFLRSFFYRYRYARHESHKLTHQWPGPCQNSQLMHNNYILLVSTNQMNKYFVSLGCYALRYDCVWVCRRPPFASSI